VTPYKNFKRLKYHPNEKSSRLNALQSYNVAQLLWRFEAGIGRRAGGRSKVAPMPLKQSLKVKWLDYMA
jgi:hypothetical protein